MNTSAVLEPVRAQRQTNLEVKNLIPFLALSFGISWGAIAAVIIVLLNCDTMFKCGNGVTDVLKTEDR